MSASPKGGNAIVNLLLLHGEKLGIAITIGLVGWLLYGSTQYAGVDKEPQELKNLADEARRNVGSFTWQDALSDPERRKLAKTFVPVANAEVDIIGYAPDKKGWSPAIVESIALRTDPPLLPPMDLIGSGATELMAFEGDDEFQKGVALEEIYEQRKKDRERKEQAEREAREEGRRTGGFNLADENKDRRPIQNRARNKGIRPDDDDRREIVSYVTVLAKAPVEEQTDAYWKTFENAEGFDRGSDQPTYLGYVVERREIVAGEAKEWEKVYLRNGYDNERLPGVDARTMLKSTADWIDKSDGLAARNYTHKELTFPLPPVVGRAWGAEAMHPDVPTEDEASLDDSRFNRFDSRRDFDDLGGSVFGSSSEDADEQDQEEEEFEERLYEAPFLMVRFFDLTVSPGKQYQYRVQLIVEDPNGSVPRSSLSKEVLARLDSSKKKPTETRFRMSEWSEPTAPISVPQAGGVLLASTRPVAETAHNAEPAVTLRVASYDTQEEKLVEASTDRTFQRGGVANFNGVDIEYILDNWLVKTDEYQFRTDVTILDISGGKKLLGRDDTTPAEVLVMDASGDLSVRDEFTDELEVLESRAVYTGEDVPDGPRGSGPSRPSSGGFEDFGGFPL